MAAYYNENDLFCVAWLRELIRRGLIADGEVDPRSIADVQPEDLNGFTQHHFFAGIGGWSLALRLSGWPDLSPVWTGSCPCQPFSAAGAQKGFDDHRHLWPEFHRLIRKCQPQRVFGEQVASALAWLDLVSGDLESEGYAVRSAIIGAHSVGAPHIRQRIYWVADSTISRRPGTGEHERRPSPLPARPAEYGGVEQPALEQMGIPGRAWESGSAVGIASSQGLSERIGNGRIQQETVESSEGQALKRPSDTFWSSCDWLPCIDNRSRPVEPGTFPLAHGIPGRVGRLRGYGNAIVPQVATEFIMSYMECMA